MFRNKAIQTTTIASIGAALALISTTTFASDDVYNQECECIPTNNKTRHIPVTVRDFKSSHPDFESTIGADYNIVTNKLGDDNLPVYKSNKRTRTTTGAENFNQWFRDVEGVNISIPMTMELQQLSPGVWEYSNSAFFPIDNMGWASGKKPARILNDIYPINWWNQNNAKNSITTLCSYNFNQCEDPKTGHNFHFTLETHLKFDYNGGEELTFIGDDDLFVYINGKLAINLGGVHSALKRHIKLDDIAQKLGIVPGQRYNFDLFFAERHLSQSNFKFQTTINLECN